MDRAHVTPRENEQTNGEQGRDDARDAIFGVLRDATRRVAAADSRCTFTFLSPPPLPPLSLARSLTHSPESFYCGIVLRPFNRSCNSLMLPPFGEEGGGERSREAIDGEESCVWHRLNLRTRDEKLITPSPRYNPWCDADSPHCLLSRK